MRRSSRPEPLSRGPAVVKTDAHVVKARAAELDGLAASNGLPHSMNASVARTGATTQTMGALAFDGRVVLPVSSCDCSLDYGPDT